VVILAIGCESAMESVTAVASRLVGSAFASGSGPSQEIVRTFCAPLLEVGMGAMERLVSRCVLLVCCEALLAFARYSRVWGFAAGKLSRSIGATLVTCGAGWWAPEGLFQCLVEVTSK
jgi:hypothetical protein